MIARKAHRRLYLDRYAAPEAAAAPALSREYERVLTIPAFDEPEDFLVRTLPPGARDVLVVLVPNVPDSLDPADPAVDRTRKLCRLAGRFDAARNIDVVAVGRVETPIPARHGVGLARRIGADVALRYIEERRIERPIVFCTDADAALPAGYFDAPRDGGTAAWVYPFTHVSDDPALREAGLGYELSLRYYVNRLAYAGSPYAFHTIGSCLAVHATAYAIVRGFPRRSAAEDFYVLNKLAKAGSVHRLGGPVIEIEARASHRVPFGTGPAIARAPDALESRMDYAPQTFELLRSLHETASRGRFDEWPEPIGELLATIGYERFRPPRRNPRAFHTWFDALKTVRFVHAARRWFADVPLVEALRSLYPAAAGPRAWNDALRAEEARMCGPIGVARTASGNEGLVE